MGLPRREPGSLAWKLLNLGFTVLHNDPGRLLKIHAPGLHLSKILIHWFWSWAQDPASFGKLPSDSPLHLVDSDWAESIWYSLSLMLLWKRVMPLLTEKLVTFT